MVGSIFSRGYLDFILRDVPNKRQRGGQPGVKKKPYRLRKDAPSPDRLVKAVKYCQRQPELRGARADDRWDIIAGVVNRIFYEGKAKYNAGSVKQAYSYWRQPQRKRDYSLRAVLIRLLSAEGPTFLHRRHELLKRWLDEVLRGWKACPVEWRQECLPLVEAVLRYEEACEAKRRRRVEERLEKFRALGASLRLSWHEREMRGALKVLVSRPLSASEHLAVREEYEARHQRLQGKAIDDLIGACDALDLPLQSRLQQPARPSPSRAWAKPTIGGR